MRQQNPASIIRGYNRRPLIAARGIILCLALSAFHPTVQAVTIGDERYVENIYHSGDFRLVDKNTVALLVVDSGDYPGVIRAVNDLQQDVERVTGRKTPVVQDGTSVGANVIIIGTVGKSEIISRLSNAGKIDVTTIAGKWESFLIQVVEKPMPGVASALVIAGSDKRGTIFGVYELSGQIGVSPWYLWDDVPVEHHDELFVKPGARRQGPPAVKYRGIFLNDEAPSLTGWVTEK